MTYPDLSMWKGSSKIRILLISGTLSVGGCWGHGCYSQPNLRVISQNSASHKCTDTIFMTKKCIFDGVISNLFGSNRVWTPCIIKSTNWKPPKTDAVKHLSNRVMDYYCVWYQSMAQLRTPNWSEKLEKFGQNVAAFSSTKTLGLGCNYWPCSAGYFLVMHPSS